MGRALWWREVRITARSAPTAATAATPPARCPGRAAPGRGSIQGASHTTTPSTPGSRPAALRPRRPARTVTRSDRSATARMAGPASNMSPSLSSRATRA